MDIRCRVLIVDDDRSTIKTISQILQRIDIESDFSMTLKEGLRKIDQEDYDVVLLDVKLPDGNGIDHIPGILDQTLPPQIIILTGFSNPDGAQLAIENGAWDYLPKPVPPKDLQLQVSRALQYQAQKRTSINSTAFSAPDILGNSKPIQQCLEQSAQIVNSDANVLITGKTGTGKELFAKAIHENSARRHGEFIVVDCSVLSENLIESVLFGHEKGAFTGADKYRKGLIELANGGTLFMDEVGELPELMQSSFLRVLQEKKFRPIGSEKEIYSDFRVICATNRDLDKMASDRLFRTDLLFRLKTFTLKLPPLKDRKGDIPVIARAQVQKCCQSHGVPKKAVSPDFREMLERYHWPGNVRELINAIEISVTSAQFEDTLFSIHLPAEIRAQIASSKIKKETASPLSSPPNLPAQGRLTHKEVMAHTEKHYLESLYLSVGGDIPKLIELTALSRSVLYRKLKKYHIH